MNPRLSIDKRHKLRDAVVKHARIVAEASGGILGLLVRPLYDRAFKDRPERMS